MSNKVLSFRKAHTQQRSCQECQQGAGTQPCSSPIPSFGNGANIPSPHPDQDNRGMPYREGCPSVGTVDTIRRFSGVLMHSGGDCKHPHGPTMLRGTALSQGLSAKVISSVADHGSLQGGRAHRVRKGSNQHSPNQASLMEETLWSVYFGREIFGWRYFLGE